MQRVLERAARARRMANNKRVNSWASKQKKTLEKFQVKQQRMPYEATFKAARKEARIKRREDWELGPLAPRRDVGEHALQYGTVSIYNANPPPRYESHRTRMDHLRVGDRVVLIKGRDRGKIGEIVRIGDKEQCMVFCAGFNMADISVPNWMTYSEERDLPDTIVPNNMGTPVEHVRLVYPLKDPATGEVRDTIIEDMKLMFRWYDVNKDGRTRRRKEPVTYRAIKGSNIIIPWPEKDDPPEEDEHACDTVDADVREITYDAPTLLYSPMPMGVIDELRHKYSRFRKRYSWEYIEAKEAEDAKEAARKNLINTMKTPTQQIAEAKLRQKAERTTELDEQQLASIGAVIAAAQAKTLNKVASAPSSA